MGFAAYTDTRVCRNCNEVVDVITGIVDSEGAHLAGEVNKCPVCNSAVAERWVNHECPKCKNVMIKDGSIMLWD